MKRRDFFLLPFVPFVAKAVVTTPAPTVSQHAGVVRINEWFKCANDPAYFIEKYVIDGKNMSDFARMPQEMYPHHRNFINACTKHSNIIGCWGRLTGKSNILTAYALHQLLFHRVNIGYIAPRFNMATSANIKMKLYYDRLPEYLKIRDTVWAWNRNKVKLGYHTTADAQCDFVSAGSCHLRGMRWDLVIADEAAFCSDEELESIFITRPKRIITLSTSGKNNNYYKLWSAALHANPSTPASIYGYEFYPALDNIGLRAAAARWSGGYGDEWTRILLKKH